MSDRAQVFAKCGKTILAVHANGESVQPHLEIIRATRLVLLEMMRELIEGSATETLARCYSPVRAVLQELHPNNRYTCAEKLVRDLADLAATLHDIEQKIERSSRERLLELRIFCSGMADELKS